MSPQQWLSPGPAGGQEYAQSWSYAHDSTQTPPLLLDDALVLEELLLDDVLLLDHVPLEEVLLEEVLVVDEPPDEAEVVPPPVPCTTEPLQAETAPKAAAAALTRTTRMGLMCS